MAAVLSWGRHARLEQTVIPLHWLSDAKRAIGAARPLLAYGNGRSYGDCCLNEGGRLLFTRPLDRLIAFDRERGLLRAEAGITLSEILDVIAPKGWFLPVTPGTRFATLGGAIANDVHGKNHHRAGSFGAHVTGLRLLRSDGSEHICTFEQNSELFRATIAGLGLTGLILEAEIQLKPIANAYLAAETQRFDDLDAFFALSADSQSSHEYTVAWIDGLGRGAQLGRGVFMRANHAPHDPSLPTHPKAKRSHSVPLTPPFSLVNPGLMQVFNPLYYRRAPVRFSPSTTHFAPFFYPLDGIRHWNRLYGPRGFFQFQCVIPPADSPAVIRKLLGSVAQSRQASFLAVLKVFGDRPSPGMLSFPRPGTTLALDLPNRGDKTADLMSRLHGIVLDAGGAIYPAKDACMPPELFEQSFPRLNEFRRWRDPAFSSSLWRRLTGEPA